jgi:hypothetical protein
MKPPRPLRQPLLLVVAACFALAAPAPGGFFYPGTATNTVPWPGGVVPYEFATNLTASQRQAYLDGLREWELAANVRFLPRSNEIQYVLFKYDPFGPNFVSGANPQTVEVNSLSRAQVCHEMGHSFGLNHENIRPDRDTFLTVLSNNVSPGNLFWFTIDPAGVTNGAYDFESVMHLGRDFASVQAGALDTQQANPGYERYQPRMGNLALSRGDRAALAFLYGPPVVSLTNVITNTADGGPGSLRAALYFAMDHPGTTITFSIPTNDPGFTNGVFVIKPTGHLPPLVTDGTVIDGSTQPGFTNKPLIVVDGSAMIPEAYAPGTATGLLIYAANCAVKNLSFRRFNWNGLTLRYADATNNVIAGCWCGLDSTGTNAAPNALQGILIYDGASRNIVGGTNAAARNVLSGNAQYGVWISGSNTVGNRILGSYVGTDWTGTSAVSNAFGGVILTGQTTGNMIGGDSTNARNVISGNVSAGIWITGVGVESNVVAGNYIGLKATGTSDLPNTFAGLHVINGAQGNLIISNVISGNASEGVRLSGAGTSGNRVEGNLVGLDAAGVNPIGNGFGGVTIFSGATSNVVGGLTAAQRNVISGNGTVGVDVGGAGVAGNVVRGNFIGPDVAGGGASFVGNGFAGLYVIGGARSNWFLDNVVSDNGSYGFFISDTGTSANVIQGNRIGTDTAGVANVGNGFNGLILFGGASSNVIGLALDGSGAGNRIAFNGSDGLRLDDTNTAGNTMRGNLVYSNGGLGLELGGPSSFGVTANDAGDGDAGPNRLQNFPTITNAAVWGPAMHLAGVFNSTPNRSFVVDFYRSTTADASGHGEGEFYLGSTSVMTDSSGNATFSFGAAGAFSNHVFTATATDLVTGDTSEFSVSLAGDGLTSGPALTPDGGQPLLASGGVFLSFSVEPGWQYRLQASTNLAAWVEISTNVANTNLIPYADLTATNFPRRFYRLLSP